MLDGTVEQLRHALGRYQRHNDEVSRAPCRPTGCSSTGVEDGWEPLCAFLGLPVPDAPFPHLNDRDRVPLALRAAAPTRAASRPLVCAVATPRLSAVCGRSRRSRSLSQEQALDALGMADDPFAQRIFASLAACNARSLALLDDHAARHAPGPYPRLRRPSCSALAVAPVERLDVDLTRDRHR